MDLKHAAEMKGLKQRDGTPPMSPVWVTDKE